MSRHPYTHANDMIRHFGPRKGVSPVLSRSDASRIREAIANAVGVSDEEFAATLSNWYQDHSDELSKEVVRQYQESVYALSTK